MEDEFSRAQVLFNLAFRAQELSYSPYSNFAVGAALLTCEGETFCGCNVENSSYGATVCAERVAIFNMIACGKGNPVELAVVTETGGFPCGICLQVLQEFAPDFEKFKIHVCNLNGVVASYTLSQLMPNAFDRQQLKSL